MNDLINSPLLKTAFLLASRFGWSLAEINALTPAQAEVFVKMIHDSR